MGNESTTTFGAKFLEKFCLSALAFSSQGANFKLRMAIPFTIPAKYQVLVKTGEVIRQGALLKSKDSGLIVAHLQEAGKFAQTVGNINPILGGINAVSNVGQNVQLEQVKSQLEQVKNMLGGLQMIGTATLAVSAINLGVSVAGFAIVAQRLKKIENRLGGMESKLDTIEAFARRLDLQQAAKNRARISSLMHRANEAWARRDCDSIWRELESRLLDQDHYLRALLELGQRQENSIFLNPATDIFEAISVWQSLSQIVATRIQSLILLNHLEAADLYIRDVSEWLDSNFSNLTSAKIADSRPNEALGFNDPETARIEVMKILDYLVQSIRVQQEFTPSVLPLLNTLEAKKIDGREYITTARDTHDHSVLLLEAI